MCVISYKGNGRIGRCIGAWVFSEHLTQKCDFRNKFGKWLMWKEETYLIL